MGMPEWMETINFELAKGEQALVCLRQIELSISNVELRMKSE
jgi:hypothetical protein